VICLPSLNGIDKQCCDYEEHIECVTSFSTTRRLPSRDSPGLARGRNSNNPLQPSSQHVLIDVWTFFDAASFLYFCWISFQTQRQSFQFKLFSFFFGGNFFKSVSEKINRPQFDYKKSCNRFNRN
jgi:hypothetical protein